MKEETKYLGFIIDREGIKPDLQKVEVIRAATVRHVRGFIGAIGYYRRFIPSFSRLAAPLIALTKNMRESGERKTVKKAFDNPKEQLSAIPLSYKADDIIH